MSDHTSGARNPVSLAAQLLPQCWYVIRCPLAEGGDHDRGQLTRPLLKTRDVIVEARFGVLISLRLREIISMRTHKRVNVKWAFVKVLQLIPLINALRGNRPVRYAS